MFFIFFLLLVGIRIIFFVIVDNGNGVLFLCKLKISFVVLIFWVENLKVDLYVFCEIVLMLNVYVDFL